MTPTPYFHDDSGALRFWVVADDGTVVGATISRETLHYRFQGKIDGSDAVDTYRTNHQPIDDAVRRRIAGGSIEPVMLREFDVAAAKRL